VRSCAPSLLRPARALHETDPSAIGNLRARNRSGRLQQLGNFSPRNDVARAGGDPAVGAWLRFDGNILVHIREGVNTIGRGERCHVVLQDPLVSREHATIELHGQDATLTDLHSLNGVEVNGQRVDAPVPLRPGDRVIFGSHVAVFGLAAGLPRAANPLLATQRVSPLPAPLSRPPDSEPTAVHGLSTLAPIAEKALALGRAPDAERLLKGVLQAVLRGAQLGRITDREEFDQATLLAARLAQATHRALWLNYVFELGTAVSRVLAAPTIELLHEVIRGSAPFDHQLLSAYLETMQGRSAECSVAERFLLRRLEGLAAVARS
jgi:pSer/pThr/pTyr-binding forkhead associated (FHA) protein